jgi:hypothetical protein
MSRRVRRTLIACRAHLAGAAAVVLLAACGGGGSEADSSATGSAAQPDAAETTAGSGEADFCTQAAGIDERVDEALADLEGNDPSVAEAFRQIAEELRAIQAPDEIAADWNALAGGLDRLSESFADFDVTDPESLAAMEQAEGDLSRASTNVENYLRDECGIEP